MVECTRQRDLSAALDNKKFTGPDRDRDRSQNLIEWSLGHVSPFQKISSKSVTYRRGTRTLQNVSFRFLLIVVNSNKWSRKNPDSHQNLIDHAPALQKNSSKSVHNFWRYFVHKNNYTQTERHTHSTSSAALLRIICYRGFSQRIGHIITLKPPWRRRQSSWKYWLPSYWRSTKVIYSRFGITRLVRPLWYRTYVLLQRLRITYMTVLTVWRGPGIWALSIRQTSKLAYRRRSWCGVPQGSAVGSILFLLYTAALALMVEYHGLHMHLYADDVRTYTQGCGRRQLISYKCACLPADNLRIAKYCWRNYDVILIKPLRYEK